MAYILPVSVQHLTVMELIQTCDGISSWVLAAIKEVILPAFTKYEAVAKISINAQEGVPRKPKPFSRRQPNMLNMADLLAADHSLLEVTPNRKVDEELRKIAGKIVSSATKGAQSMMQEAASFRKPSPVQRILYLEFEAAASLGIRRGALRLESPTERVRDGRSSSPISDRSLLFLSRSIAEEAAITADSVYMAVQQGPTYIFPKDLSCQVYQMLLHTYLGRISSIPDCRTKPIQEKMATNRDLHKIFLSEVNLNFMERAVKNSLELFLGLPQTPRRTRELDEVYGWINGDGQMSSVNGALENSSFWSQSSLPCSELEALVALTAVVVNQTRSLTRRVSHQKGEQSIKKDQAFTGFTVLYLMLALLQNYLNQRM